MLLPRREFFKAPFDAGSVGSVLALEAELGIVDLEGDLAEAALAGPRDHPGGQGVWHRDLEGFLLQSLLLLLSKLFLVIGGQLFAENDGLQLNLLRGLVPC